MVFEFQLLHKLWETVLQHDSSFLFLHFHVTVAFKIAFQIEEYDELSKVLCQDCERGLENVRQFFESCFNANQTLILDHRKLKESPLDLHEHINHYVRSFNSPSSYVNTSANLSNIKIEPSHYLDVGLDEDDSNDEENVFKVPPVPGTEAAALAAAKARRRKRGRPKKVNPDGTSFDPYFDDPEYSFDEKPDVKGAAALRAGRKRAVPIALKSCSECGQMFPDHASNLAHWKERHPDKEVVYKCNEIDAENQQVRCGYQSKDTEDVFRHRIKHRPKVLQPIEDKKEKLVE